ncbi:ladderlectin-like [Acanthaster planci]|uniref:Ladderlectin-like n=1 Tax=Acanthaster planci TaxID=133434 RepID=A0A8B7YAL4_ACAPL|nr:ladderlectin-like [Acanthaster planci]
MLLKQFILGLMSLHLVMGGTGGNERCVMTIGGRGMCPPTWIQWGDKCYRATQPMGWFEAKQECIQMGSVLVRPQSDEQNEFLARITPEFWINCNNLQREGVWVCLDGTVAVQYPNWEKEEPNIGLGKEHCAEVWKPGPRNDGTCDSQNPAICKQPMVPRLHF